MTKREVGKVSFDGKEAAACSRAGESSCSIGKPISQSTANPRGSIPKRRLLSRQAGRSSSHLLILPAKPHLSSPSHSPPPPKLQSQCSGHVSLFSAQVAVPSSSSPRIALYAQCCCRKSNQMSCSQNLGKKPGPRLQQGTMMACLVG